jgi:hypothetical protein
MLYSKRTVVKPALVYVCSLPAGIDDVEIEISERQRTFVRGAR